MPAINIVFLAIVILAFVIFALTLAWGDAQCRTARKLKARDTAAKSAGHS
jgi:hypothetical protein